MFKKIIHSRLLVYTILILSGCKASVDTNEPIPTADTTEGFTVFCSKFIRMHKPNGHVESVSDHSEKSHPGEQLSSTDFVAEFTYRLKSLPDGSHEITCFLSDGARQYYGSSFVGAYAAPYSDNICSLIYDLDEPTGASFNFYWNMSQRGLTYIDDYTGYSKEIFVRGSDCSEM